MDLQCHLFYLKKTRFVQNGFLNKKGDLFDPSLYTVLIPIKQTKAWQPTLTETHIGQPSPVKQAGRRVESRWAEKYEELAIISLPVQWEGGEK